MFLETPFQARFGGMWVWGLVRSGIKAVVDFMSQNLTIFSKFSIRNNQEFAPPKVVNQAQW